MKPSQVGTWILFLFICLFIAVPAATASDERAIPSVRADSEVWAVIVGISDFRFVNDLSYCDDDARDLTTYLQNDCAIPADHIVTLIDSQASKNAIQSKIAELQSKSGTDDIVVVSSHRMARTGQICPHMMRVMDTMSISLPGTRGI